MRTRLKLRLFRYLLSIVIVLALIFSVRYCGKQKRPLGYPCDHVVIAREGILYVATEYNLISFHIDSDTVSGFHYKLIEASTCDKGPKIEITPVTSFDERLKGLSDGRYDVIAYGILVANELKDSLFLVSPIILSKQMLMRRETNGENDSLYIRNQLDLAQKTFRVVKGSPSTLRIQNLGNRVGDTIYIKEMKRYGSEQLISLAAHGDINYAVRDGGIARAAVDSLPQVDINTAISLVRFYSWTVSKQSPVLFDSLSTRLDKFQREEEYQKICWKYYGDR